MIPFNKPYLSGDELKYIEKSVLSGKISGNGEFTKKCQSFFEMQYNFNKCLLTTSCTDALEMAAILINIQPGDEVIIPSYTFVSTANAFILRGASIIFADSSDSNPNLDVAKLEALITPKTRAIVPVHYAGIACDMDEIMALAAKHSLFVIEDAAQAIDSYYKGRPLGGIGHLAAFSFHETKNIISGEGGMLVINDKRFEKRAEIIWEKGTNRNAFFNGEVDKYGWVDVGSSFLPSEVTAAFLYAQLENLSSIQKKRKAIWDQYYNTLLPVLGRRELPVLPDYATQNGHLFYLICKNITIRDQLLSYLKSKNIFAVFHYLSLHKSPFYSNKHDGRALPICDRYADCLVRLPLYFELTDEQQNYISNTLISFFKK